MIRLQTAVLFWAVLLSWLPAHGQITFRAASSATAAGITPAFRSAASATTTGATLTVTRPSGVALDDVLIGSIAVTPSSAAITPPSGWTLVRRTDNAGPTSNSLAIYRRVATGAEPTSYAWGISGANFTVGGIQAFTGVDTAAPVEVENGQSTPSSTTHATPNITSTSANAMIVASHTFASSQSWTPPTGMTESLEVKSGSNNATGLSIEASRVLQPLPGPTGTKTATAGGTADSGNAHILALRPRGALLTISKPAGTDWSDVLFAAIGFNNHTAAVSPPTGWTLVRRINNLASTSNSLVIYRAPGSSGAGSFSWTITGGTFIVGGIQAFSGVNQNSPIDAENGHTTASGTNHDTPSVTTTVANAMLVTSHTYASSQTWTAEAGLTESYERPSGGNSATGQSITGARQLQSVAGASGTKRSTAAGFADVGATHVMALRPGPPNQPPSATFTTPPSGSLLIATIPIAPITLTVNATDPDGTISEVRLSDCAGNTIATDTTPPYTFVWTPPSPYYDEFGFHNTFVCAHATDNFGTTSASDTILLEYQPTVTLTSPANGANFTAPTMIQLAATHSTPGGPIQKMQFFNGTTLLGEDFTAPYTFDWQSAPTGTHALMVKAIANDAREYPSSISSITVTAAEARLHFIDADHLGTPRLITNAQQQAVWRHDQAEPFGNTPPDENPSGLGAFEFPLRDDGTYFDKETGMVYNWHRYRDLNSGRFIQADPLGLAGGDLSLYVLVKNNPLRYTDPHGLKVQRCCRPADIVFGAVDHCWLKTDTVTAGMNETAKCTAAGNNASGLPYSTVVVSDHSCDTATSCTDVTDVDEDCVNKQLTIGRYLGRFSPTNNCQTFVLQAISQCKKYKGPWNSPDNPDFPRLPPLTVPQRRLSGG